MIRKSAMEWALLIVTILWTAWLVYKNIQGSLIDNYVTIILLYIQLIIATIKDNNRGD